MKRLTAGDKVIKVPVDSEKLDIGNVVRGFAGHARDWEVGVSWFDALFGRQEERQEDDAGSREIQVKRGKEKEECLRLTILDSDCLPCQGFWPAYKAPDLGRVTHLCLRKGMAGVNVDWSAFPLLTHLAVFHQEDTDLGALFHTVKRIQRAIPTFCQLLLLVRPVLNLELFRMRLSLLQGLDISFTSDFAIYTTTWDVPYLSLLPGVR